MMNNLKKYYGSYDRVPLPYVYWVLSERDINIHFEGDTSDVNVKYGFDLLMSSKTVGVASKEELMSEMKNIACQNGQDVYFLGMLGHEEFFVKFSRQIVETWIDTK